MLNRMRALALLDECTGDDIWPVDHCRARGIPEAWIDELADCFESGFETDTQTIYYQDSVTNQFYGVRDVDLALRLGAYLDVDVEQARQFAASRQALVQRIKETLEEG